MKEKGAADLRDGTNKCSGQLRGLALEIFKKFDVDMEKIQTEVCVVNFEMVDYEEKNKVSVFGEKESISYMLHFIIYNIEFEAKLLTFEYETKSELLKLDINCKTVSACTEIKYCCNFLQRRRNLDLMFTTFICFTRYLESRRLICDVILRKSGYIQIEENRDGGKIVIYSDEKRKIKLGIFWSVECNSEHEVIDKLEIYYKVAELPNKDNIKQMLTQLTEPHWEFNIKYHLWRDLLDSLSDDRSVITTHNACKVRSHSSSSIGKNNETCTNSEEMSVIRHPHLKLNRTNVKKEEPNEQEDDDDIAIISSSPDKNSPSESNPLVCIKNPKLLSKNSKEASILLSYDSDLLSNVIDGSNCCSSSDESNHIIYIDSLDDKSVTGMSRAKHKICNKSRSTLLERSSILRPIYTDTSHNRFPRTNTIALSNIDTESVIVLPSDCEDHQEDVARKTNSSSHTGITVIKSSTPINQVSFLKPRDSPKADTLDFALPAKKPKIIDDDLEITGVTYVVPD